MSTQDSSVLVIGGTGQQGGAAARHLMRRGRPVRFLVRDADTPAAQALCRAGAVPVVGDLDDVDSLSAALTGVPAVCMALSMMAGPRITAEGVAATAGGVTPPGPSSSRSD